tara:strand:- start:98 stop:274 length:177 start_codon:yes stop_codon:yes gene_type:complete
MKASRFIKEVKRKREAKANYTLYLNDETYEKFKKMYNKNKIRVSETVEVMMKEFLQFD